MQWYNVNEPSKFIVYLDEYNVYSWEIFFNTCGGFEWSSRKTWN